MSKSILLIVRRKVCLEDCGYDKTQQAEVIGGKLPLPLNKQSYKVTFRIPFSRHNHKTKTTTSVEIYDGLD